jgi:NAD-dependent DNA ligase
MDSVYDKLKILKQRADDAYFNSGSPIMKDCEYDALCQRLESNLKIEEIGCLPPQSEGRIKLPVHLGSLTKFNDDHKLQNFLVKFNHCNEFVVQEKLDGVSCLYHNDNNEIKLYTRGNGSIGTLVTHLIDCGLKLPKINENVIVRGELILKKRIFEEKYSKLFKNARNMVSGQLSKKIPQYVLDMDFVAYEVINPKTKHQKSLSEQYLFLQKHGFKVVYNRIIKRKNINQKTLMDYLNRRKDKSLYQMDGLVITLNEKYIRNKDGNPKYSFAFKIQGETAEVEVTTVKWNLSKSGKYKPQIFIKPVYLSGVTISSLTGFNAKYIIENGITTSTKLLITRSGDVIPHIIAVLEKGHHRPELPKNSVLKSVDLYHISPEISDEVTIKQMVHFFSSLKCLNCKDKTIIKIYNAGFKTIESIVSASSSDLSNIDGIGCVLAKKITSSINEKIKDATTHELLAALNAFGEGIGLKKIGGIDILKPETIVPGLSETTIKEKILPVWDISLNRVKNLKMLVGGNINLVTRNDDFSGYFPLKNQIFVFTGFRDTTLEKKIIEFGGKVGTSITKKTTYLVMNSTTIQKSTKTIKSESLGIKIILKSEMIDLLDKAATNSPEKIEVDYDHYSSSDEE